MYLLNKLGENDGPFADIEAETKAVIESVYNCFVAQTRVFKVTMDCK